MASIKSHNGKWRAFVFKLGVRKTKVFDVKAKAVAWAATAEAEILAGKAEGIPDKSFGDLLRRYLAEVTPTKGGARSETLRIGRFLKEPFAEVRLSDLGTTHFAQWRDKRLSQVSEATVLRERNTLSNACKRAHEEWKWLEHHPMKGVVMPEKPESRDRTATDDEIERILFVLGDGFDTVNGRIGMAVRFALETAMREAEIANLQWSDIEPKFCRVRRGKTRAARRDVPLSPAAIKIIKQMPKTHDGVFNLKASQIDSQYRAARDKAVTDGLRFHDLRHTAVTRLAKKLDVMALARMIGHTNLKTLLIYYNPSADDLADRL